MHNALLEIGFAFVFDHGGISLLWDVIMQTESPQMAHVATEILRWLVRENQGFGDHIFEFCSQYAHVEEEETKLKAETIRCRLFGGLGKRKRSDIDASEGRREKQTLLSSENGRLEVDDSKAKESDSDTGSDWSEFIYSSEESDTED